MSNPLPPTDISLDFSGLISDLEWVCMEQTTSGDAK